MLDLLEGDALFSWRHTLASLVHAAWVDPQEPDASLAPHFFDGSYAALEDFIVDGAEAIIAASADLDRSVPSVENLTVPDFTERFMAANQPVLAAGLTAHWPARSEWVDGCGGPDLGVLAARYGEAVVEVEAPPKVEPVTGEAPGATSGSYERPRTRQRLCDVDLGAGGYIKDWHFAAQWPEEAERLIPTPPHFGDDWLNAFSKATLLEQGSTQCVCDYEFVYMGRPGTRTHLHADVLGSYSWSTNVCGHKAWRFLHPALTYLARDTFGRRLAPSLSEAGADEWRFPLAAAARRLSVQVTQAPGDALFVPSEWHHSVANIGSNGRGGTFTLSVNANWFNRHSLAFVVRRLRRDALASLLSRAHRLVFGGAQGSPGGGSPLGVAPSVPPSVPPSAVASALPPDVAAERPECHTEDALSTAPGDAPSRLCGFASDTREEQSMGPSACSSVGQVGKAPFDAADLVRLLEWKARECGDALDLDAVVSAARQLATDPLISLTPDLRARARAVAEAAPS